jgi:hypothetical protein
MVHLNNKKNLLEQQSLEDKKKKHKSKTSSKDNSNTQSLEDKKKKHKSKKPSTDNTTIPSPQTSDNTDKVNQTSNVELTPKTDPTFTIWLQWSGSPQEFNQPEFVKAIQTAYDNKDKRQDVY